MNLRVIRVLCWDWEKCLSKGSIVALFCAKIYGARHFALLSVASKNISATFGQDGSRKPTSAPDAPHETPSSTLKAFSKLSRIRETKTTTFQRRQTQTRRMRAIPILTPNPRSLEVDYIGLWNDSKAV